MQFMQTAVISFSILRLHHFHLVLVIRLGVGVRIIHQPINKLPNKT